MVVAKRCSERNSERKHERLFTWLRSPGDFAPSHMLKPLVECKGVCPLLQTKGEVLGRLRGVSVKMLMHHSRNSEQKQWDETLVLALSGMGRLFRAHLPLLVPMPAFPQVSQRLFCEHCVVSAKSL